MFCFIKQIFKILNFFTCIVSFVVPKYYLILECSTSIHRDSLLSKYCYPSVSNTVFCCSLFCPTNGTVFHLVIRDLVIESSIHGHGKNNESLRHIFWKVLTYKQSNMHLISLLCISFCFGPSKTQNWTTIKLDTANTNAELFS